MQGAVGFQEAQDAAGFTAEHFLDQLAIGKLFVADDVDRADFRLRTFADLEDQVDAVLRELDDLGLDDGGKAAFALFA